MLEVLTNQSSLFCECKERGVIVLKDSKLFVFSWFYTHSTNRREDYHDGNVQDTELLLG